MENDVLVLRRIEPADAQALAVFYNSLSPAVIRLFRPLGWQTTLETCQQITAENGVSPAKRFDLVACLGTEIAGWAFLANLDSSQPYLGIGLQDRIQDRGLGRVLVGRLLAQAREQGIPKIYLTVVVDNQRAIHLYRSYGFATYDQKIDAFDGVDYFHMAVEL